MQAKKQESAHTGNHKSDARPFVCHELQICQFLFHHQLSLKWKKMHLLEEVPNSSIKRCWIKYQILLQIIIGIKQLEALGIINE